MIKVQKVGNRNRVLNPQTGQWQEVVNIIFVEEGRGGAISSMSETSAALSNAVGQNVGLNILRTHTHPVLVDTVAQFPVGKEFPSLFINRKLFSQPQLNQQLNVDSRMIEGKPTYFTTYISAKAEEDIDMRLSNELLAKVNPEAFSKSRVGATRTELVGENVQNLGQTQLGQRVNARVGTPVLEEA